MIVDVVLGPGGFDPETVRGKSVAAIDILRSSSTLITALSNRARKIFLFEDPEEAREKSRGLKQGSVLLCGERGGLKIGGFDLGNSPVEYSADVVRNKTLFFSSTNGSKMILKASRTATSVIIACFNNLTVAVNHLVQKDLDVVLVCSGKNNQFSLEDAVCAGMMADQLRRKCTETYRATDEAFSAVLLYRHFKDDLSGLMHFSEHGRYLKRIGMGTDLEYCARMDSLPVVPVLKNGFLGLQD